jgi:pimeloyl-ACP methyl ester carboxylesterase
MTRFGQRLAESRAPRTVMPTHPGFAATARPERLDSIRRLAVLYPTASQRLRGLEIPTLVLWGDSDRIAGPEYGRAYVDLIPTARFRIVAGVGHQSRLSSLTQ